MFSIEIVPILRKIDFTIIKQKLSSNYRSVFFDAGFILNFHVIPLYRLLKNSFLQIIDCFSIKYSFIFPLWNLVKNSIKMGNVWKSDRLIAIEVCRNKGAWTGGLEKDRHLWRTNYFGIDDWSSFTVFYAEIPRRLSECIIEWQATCSWQRLIKQPIMRLICRTRRCDAGPDTEIRNYIFVPMMTNVCRGVYIDGPASTFMGMEILGTFITVLRWKIVCDALPWWLRYRRCKNWDSWTVPLHNFGHCQFHAT